MNLSTSKFLYLLTRVVFTRLSTALVLFYVAITFPSEMLGHVSLAILIMNFNELIVENGSYESLIKNFSSVKLNSHKIVAVYISFFVSAVLIGLVYINFFKSHALVFIFCIISQGLVLPKIIRLKYRRESKILHSVFLKAGIALVFCFFLVQFMFKNILTVALAYSAYYIVILYYIRPDRTLINFPWIKFKFDTDVITPFFFKFTNFLNSRTIEAVIPLNIGMSSLSNYIAGSRVYNITYLLFYTLLNEFSLKSLSKNVNISHFYRRYLQKVVLPSCIICLCLIFNSQNIISIMFNDKFNDAAEIFSYFCVYLVFQILVLPLAQLQMINFNMVETATQNLLILFVTIFVLFSLEYDNVIDLVLVYLASMMVVNSISIGYMFYKLDYKKGAFYSLFIFITFLFCCNLII